MVLFLEFMYRDHPNLSIFHKLFSLFKIKIQFTRKGAVSLSCQSKKVRWIGFTFLCLKTVLFLLGSLKEQTALIVLCVKWINLPSWCMNQACVLVDLLFVEWKIDNYRYISKSNIKFLSSLVYTYTFLLLDIIVLVSWNEHIHSRSTVGLGQGT